MVTALKGTPEQRKRLKAQQRRENEVAYARSLGQTAGNGHDKVKAIGRVALAASKRMTDDASRRLALALARAVEELDIPENWRKSS